MLNIAFGQSKYFIDNLSENVKRGHRQKLRLGVYPGEPPTGYLNDMRSHTIILDKPKDKLMRKIFELYSTGEYTLDRLRQIADKIELTSNRGKPMKISIRS